MNLGDLKLQILLDVVPLNESIKTSLNLLKMFSANADAILKLKPPSIKPEQFDAEIKKLDASLNRHQSELKETTSATHQLDTAQKSAAVSTVRMAGAMESAFLRVQGFQSVIYALKSSFGSLLTAYQEQEVANSKLLNNLKNTGEGMAEFNRLTSQASDLQSKTVYGDEQIIQAQAMLGTFKKSSEEISILTPRILDLAAAFDSSGEGGKSLMEVAVMLGKVNEETIGTLRRVGVAFTKEEEEKLKSLKGTEQAIYFTEILDSNFKGLAETVGKTSAGQMAIFKNSVGELKESLGQFIAEALAPTAQSFSALIASSGGMSDFFKVLVLGAIAAAAAFVVLGTSMGGIPYIILGIVTVLGALSQAFNINTDRIEANKQAMLESQAVNESMKQTLDKLSISANNMSEAYSGISNAIIGMTRVQLESAEQFVNAEIAKIEALRETAKAFRQNELMKMDIGYYDASKRSDMESRQFIDMSEFGANLDKLQGIKDQISAKKKFTPDSKTPGTSRSGSTSNSDIKQQTNDVRDLTRAWERQIGIFYTAEQFTAGFVSSGMSLVDVLSAVNSELSKSGTYTEEQILDLVKYRDSVLDMMKSVGVTLTGSGLAEDDPVKLAAKFTAERMAWYEEYGSKDKRFKPLSEASEYAEAVKLVRELKGDQISLNDLQTFANTLREKANSLDATSEKIAREKLNLIKEAEGYESDILKIRQQASDAIYASNRTGIELIENEFARRRKLLELEHKKDLANLDELIKKARSAEELNALTSRRGSLSKLYTRKQSELDAEEMSAFITGIDDALTSSMTTAQTIAKLFGKAGDNISEAFQRALAIAQAIRAVFETIALIKGVIALFSGGGALPGFHTGGLIPGSGDIPILAQGGEGIIRRDRMTELTRSFGPGFFNWLNGTSHSNHPGVYHNGGIVSSAMSRGMSTREVPYIATTEVSGPNLKLVLARQNKIDTKRSNG